MHDPGEESSDSRAYWDKMAREGLVTEMFDADDQKIELPQKILSAGMML